MQSQVHVFLHTMTGHSRQGCCFSIMRNSTNELAYSMLKKLRRGSSLLLHNVKSKRDLKLKAYITWSSWLTTDGAVGPNVGVGELPAVLSRGRTWGIPDFQIQRMTARASPMRGLFPGPSTTDLLGSMHQTNFSAPCAPRLASGSGSGAVVQMQVLRTLFAIPAMRHRRAIWTCTSSKLRSHSTALQFVPV